MPAKKGYQVFLLDLDAYAPSLQAYFDKEPRKWINDLLNCTAEVGDVMVDLTSMSNKCNDTTNSIPAKENEKERYVKMNNGR